MSGPHPYFVYLLWSPAGRRFYIGVTDDVSRRLAQHNAGISTWTRRFAGSWQLLWSTSFPSLSEARCFERLLKRQKSGTGLWRLTGVEPPLDLPGS